MRDRRSSDTASGRRITIGRLVLALLICLPLLAFAWYVWLAASIGTRPPAAVLPLVYVSMALLPVIFVFVCRGRYNRAVVGVVLSLLAIFVAIGLWNQARDERHERQRASKANANRDSLSRALETLPCSSGDIMAVHADPAHPARAAFRLYPENLARNVRIQCVYLTGKDQDTPWCAGLMSSLIRDHLNCSSDRYASVYEFLAAYYGDMPLRYSHQEPAQYSARTLESRVNALRAQQSDREP